ncbi:transposase [Neobacillus kokaensis]|uniref:transposase n=1 Tax=Neobacillus kokaensis TaxID=2759023 RepID=UPI00351A281A
MRNSNKSFYLLKNGCWTVFGQIKHNRGFNRFSLRGLSKNITEWGLICVAHNLMKWESITKNQLKVAEE